MTDKWALGLNLIFFGYFVFGLQVWLDHMGGHGLRLPINIIGWSAMSLMVGVLMFYVRAAGYILITPFSVCLLLISVLITFHFFSYGFFGFNSGGGARIAGLIFGVVLLVLMQQYFLSEKSGFSLFYVVLIGMIVQSFLILFPFLGVDSFQLYDLSSGRPLGAFGQPNVLSSWLATGLVLLIWLVVFSQKKTSVLFYFFSSASLIVFTTLLWMIQSRSAMLGVMLSFLFFWLSIKKQHFKSLFLCTIMITFTVLSFEFLAEADSALKKTERELVQDDYRLRAYSQSIELALESFWLGVGYGNFYKEYRSLDVKNALSDDNSERVVDAMLLHPHNEVLFWVVEGGVFYWILIVLFSVITWGLFIRNKARDERVVLVLVIPLFVHSMLEYPFYHSVAHWIFFLVLLAFISSRLEIARAYPLKWHVLPFFLAIAVPLVVCTYMLTALQSNLTLVKYFQSNGRDIMLLNEVRNPHSMSGLYDFEVRRVELDLAIMFGNTESVENFVEWSSRRVVSNPTIPDYLALLDAYEFMGDEAMLQATLSEAIFWFPNNKTLLNYEFRTE